MTKRTPSETLAAFMDAVADMEWVNRTHPHGFYKSGVGLQLPPSMLRPYRRK